MKRRVSKRKGNLYRVRTPGGEDCLFEIREKRESKAMVSRTISFGNKFKLFWDGMYVEDYPSMATALVDILRYGYSLDPSKAVPSEILADFNLRHGNCNWIDSFQLTEYIVPDCDIVMQPGKVQRLSPRAIRLEGSAPHHEQKVPKSQLREKIVNREPISRFRTVSRNWADKGERLFAQINRMDNYTGTKCSKSDEECVTTLITGKKAIEMFGKPEGS